MANETKPSATSGASGNAAASGNVKGAGRGKRQSVVETLDDKQRFARKQMQQARGALLTAQKALEEGRPIPAEIVVACSEIVAASGRMLFD
jgi:hypothetical protein